MADQNVCDIKLSPNLDDSLEYVRVVFTHCSDIVIRRFTLFHTTDAALLYVDGLIDKKQVEQDVIEPLMIDRATLGVTPEDMDLIERIGVHAANVTSVNTYTDAVEAALEGKAVLFLEGLKVSLVFGVAGWPQRSVNEPGTESVIRGPREGFIESVGASVAMVRRRLRTTSFKTESMQIGRYTKTDVVVCYLETIADEKLIQEVRERLSRIDADGILESGYIEEWIEDNPYSPFPQVQNTERPDVVAAMLLEGRVAILIDGTPFALLVPVNLWGALASPEDYYERYIIATFIRWLRIAFAVISLTLPSLYVAVSTFHQEFLPMPLLISIAAARENTPLPAAVEAFFMEITFEALREAGVRLPKAIGQAVSIVGALVIGQAAVQAGIVSAPMVIIVAITGIASFTVPRFNFAIAVRMLRFPIIILSGTLGIYGLIIGLIAIIVHLSSLRSFGLPYLEPISPFQPSGLKDTLARAPHWAMMDRPLQTSKKNKKRQTSAGYPHHRQPTQNQEERP